MYLIEAQTPLLKMPMTNYRIAYDICELAKYLNKYSVMFPNHEIVKVSIIDEYDITGNHGVPVAFLPCEYNTQCFIETYEERLIRVNEYQKMLEILV